MKGVIKDQKKRPAISGPCYKAHDKDGLGLSRLPRLVNAVISLVALGVVESRCRRVATWATLLPYYTHTQRPGFQSVFAPSPFWAYRGGERREKEQCIQLFKFRGMYLSPRERNGSRLCEVYQARPPVFFGVSFVSPFHGGQGPFIWCVGLNTHENHVISPSSNWWSVIHQLI